ncbi:Prefoldin subunit 2 [Lamellibrachia satsuma]|nr:Prefoldin subunit 2 [Lamellibrachia satsuma]
MASGDSSKVAKAGKAKPVNQEQVIAGFQELRNQQRAVASKVSELEMERKEHDLVVEALKEVDGSRKCFRLVGGVLVERTVKEVLPALTSNYEQLGQVVESLSHQMEIKGKELNEYREKYGIRLRGEEDSAEPQKDTKAGSAGVLVAQGAT